MNAKMELQLRRASGLHGFSLDETLNFKLYTLGPSCSMVTRCCMQLPLQPLLQAGGEESCVSGIRRPNPKRATKTGL